MLCVYARALRTSSAHQFCALVLRTSSAHQRVHADPEWQVAILISLILMLVQRILAPKTVQPYASTVTEPSPH